MLTDIYNNMNTEKIDHYFENNFTIVTADDFVRDHIINSMAMSQQ